MSALFTLYDSILVPLLIEWLTFENLPVLDTALCSSTPQCSLRDLLIKTNSHIRICGSFSVCTFYSTWLTSRGFKAEHISVDIHAPVDMTTDCGKQRVSIADVDALGNIERLRFRELATDNLHEFLSILQKKKPRIDSLTLKTEGIFGEKLTDPIFRRVVVLLDKSISSLTFVSCDTLTDESCGMIAEYLPNLEKVHFDGRWDGITATGVQIIAHAFPKLKAFTPPIVTDDLLEYITERCPLLTFLNIEAGNNISDDGILSSVARNCPLLEEICIASTHITDQSMVTLAKKCKKMKSYKLNYCTITDVTLETIAQRNPFLTSFKVENMNHITDSGLIEMARKRPGLTTIDIDCTRILSDKTVLSLAEYCPQLTRLSLSPRGRDDFSALAIMTIIKKCKKLHYLKFPLETTVDESVFVEASRGCEYLSVDTDKINYATSFKKHCHESVYKPKGISIRKFGDFEPRTIVQMAKKCPRLSVLIITNNVLTDESIEVIVKHCPLLRHISLDSNVGDEKRGDVILTDAGIAHIAKNCTDLLTWELSGCPVSDSTAVAILEKSPNIRQLRLSWCPNITSVTVLAMANTCKLLHSLSLVGTINFDYDSIRKVMSECKDLRQLDLAYCEQLKRDNINRDVAKLCLSLTLYHSISAGDDYDRTNVKRFRELFS